MVRLFLWETIRAPVKMFFTGETGSWLTTEEYKISMSPLKIKFLLGSWIYGQTRVRMHHLRSKPEVRKRAWKAGYYKINFFFRFFLCRG